MQLWRTYFFSSCACPSRLLTMFWCQIGHLDWFGVAPFRQEKDGEATIFRNYRDKGSKVKTTGIHITSHALMHLSRCIIVKLYLALPQTTRQDDLLPCTLWLYLFYMYCGTEKREGGSCLAIRDQFRTQAEMVAILSSFLNFWELSAAKQTGY